MNPIFGKSLVKQKNKVLGIANVWTFEPNKKEFKEIEVPLTPKDNLKIVIDEECHSPPWRIGSDLIQDLMNSSPEQKSPGF